MHYHSTCLGCLTPKEQNMYRLSNGEAQSPGGTAFEHEQDAVTDAARENAAGYMRDWTGHRQQVLPCASMHCRPNERTHITL